MDGPYTLRNMIDNQVLNDGRWPFRPNLVITNVRLPHTDPDLANKLWKVECRGGRVARVTQLHKQAKTTSNLWYEIDCKGSLMLPSLCHSHIHLDKCFILDKCGDLVKGDFTEAMKVTAKAKATFPSNDVDLYQRGARLVRESVECGVTSMRAHVEIDTIVGFSCLETALKLKDEYERLCDIQIAAFAQEPLFSSAGDTIPGPNFDILENGLSREGVTVVGSAPYVEPTIEQAKLNIALILQLAVAHGYHVDFHLDYNLDPNSEPLIYEVISQVRKGIQNWQRIEGVHQSRITIGHATRLQLFTPAQWRDLADAMNDLPISIVGLPQSDMYMMGRADEGKLLGPPRSTLRVPQIARDYGFQIAMGVNNVENAFTPQGSLDPLSLCTFGAAIFQSATPKDIRTLARAVTLTSKLAIGQEEIHVGLFPTRGDPADFVILHGTQTLRSAVLAPSYDRTTAHAGLIVARRRTQRWTTDIKKDFDVIYRPWYKRVQWRYLLFPPYFFYKWYKSQLMVPLMFAFPISDIHALNDTDSICLGQHERDCMVDQIYTEEV